MAGIADEVELLKLRVANLEKYFTLHFSGTSQTLLLENEIDASSISDKASAKAVMAAERGKHK